MFCVVCFCLFLEGRGVGGKGVRGEERVCVHVFAGLISSVLEYEYPVIRNLIVYFHPSSLVAMLKACTLSIHPTVLFSVNLALIHGVIYI